jgi:hypothetical protein
MDGVALKSLNFSFLRFHFNEFASMLTIAD